jgi:hypothetical protein
MTRCRTCGQPLPSLRGRRYHRRCQPSRQERESPKRITATIAQAYAEIQARRKAA